MTKSIKIRNNFQFLTVAYQNENITLMNETNIGFDSAITIGHHIRFHGVILHIFVSYEVDRSLEKNTVKRISRHLIFLHCLNLPSHPGTQPRQRGIGKRNIIGTGMYKFKTVFKIFMIWRIW